MSHLGIEEALQENVQVSHFEAGHMMYVHKPSLTKMGPELREFVESSS